MMLAKVTILSVQAGSDAKKGEWLPCVRETEWGVTDDVITLPNNQTFYFFKIPHKVR